MHRDDAAAAAAAQRGARQAAHGDGHYAECNAHHRAEVRRCAVHLHIQQRRRQRGKIARILLKKPKRCRAREPSTDIMSPLMLLPDYFMQQQHGAIRKPAHAVDVRARSYAPRKTMCGEAPLFLYEQYAKTAAIPRARPQSKIKRCSMRSTAQKQQ